MRVLKPQYLTPLISVFDDGRRLHCIVTVLFHADFAGELQKDQEIWTYANQETEGMVVDEAMPKSRGEFLVHGSCYARKPDVRQSFVKVQVGKQEKVLAVFGRRTYDRAGLSEPEPFDEVAIQFRNAFGGPSYPENPQGTGYQGGVPPQVEVRAPLLTGPNDKPPVGGFGRLEPTLPQRMKKLGTYDTRWQKTRYPGAAEDFDGAYFQLSAADQWRDDFFAGDESFSIVNMHPEKEVLEGKLPNVIGRAFIKRKDEEMMSVPMRIDTVHFYPHRQRQIIVCRGITATKSDTLADIEEGAFALEWIGQPKSDSHYLEAFAVRKKRGGSAASRFDDQSFLPEGNPKPGPKARIAAPGEGLKQRTMERQLQSKLDELRQTMIAQGLDTAELDKYPRTLDTTVDPDSIPPREPVRSMDDIKKTVQEKTEEALTKMRGEIEMLDGDSREKASASLAELGEKLRQGPVGPPSYSRKKTREQLEDQATLMRNAGLDPSVIQAQLDDPKLDARMRELEDFVREGYRSRVQHQGVAPAIDQTASDPLRVLVLEMIERGEALADVDLTGADLSGLDLRGAKLSRAFMESANLSGANLSGALLDRAVLARANLAGANLINCTTLEGANLSETNLTGVDLSGLNLTGCFFAGANLEGTKFVGCVLDRTDFGKTNFLNTDMSRSKSKNLKFHKVRLENVLLRGAEWERPLFYECEMVGLDARGANLPNMSIVDTSCESANFDDAKLLKLRAAKALGKTTMPKCSFVGATIHKGLFRGVEMRECDFRHSDCKEADFSEANLDDSTFEDARLVAARFMGSSIRRCKFDRVDLMDGLLGNALMDNASFDTANLFRADFGRSQGEGVKMSGANVKYVRTVPKREEST